MAEGNDLAVGKGGHGAWVGDGLGMGVRPSLYCFALFIHRCYNICEKSMEFRGAWFNMKAMARNAISLGRRLLSLK